MNKPLVPMSRRQMVVIANNVVRCVRERNIDLLTKQSYHFLYLCSGFIAHYNLFGFREAYRDTEDFAESIMKRQGQNQWNNFRPGERDYDYNMAKKECYNLICDGLEQLGYDKVENRGYTFY